MSGPDVVLAELVRQAHVLGHCLPDSRLLEVLWPTTADSLATPTLHSHTRLHLDAPDTERATDPIVTRVGDSTSSWPVAGPFDTIALSPLSDGVWDETWLRSLAQASSLLSPRGTLLVVPPARLGESRCVRDLRHEGLAVVDALGLTAPPDALLAAALAERFGPGGADLHRAMRSRLPAWVISPALAVVGDVATSSMLVCRRP